MSWLQKYKDGGKVQPLYVDSPNDPRYRAYQDSLRYYNKDKSNYEGETKLKYDVLLKALPSEKVIYTEKGTPISLNKKPVQPVIVGQPMSSISPIGYDVNSHTPMPQMPDQIPVPQMQPGQPEWEEYTDHFNKATIRGKRKVPGLPKFPDGGKIRIATPEEWKSNKPKGIEQFNVQRQNVVLSDEQIEDKYIRPLVKKITAVGQYIPSPVQPLMLAANSLENIHDGNKAYNAGNIGEAKIEYFSALPLPFVSKKK